MIPAGAEEVARLTGSALLSPGKPGQRFARVSTDTRTLEPGALFVALRGRRYDAHDFLDQALERGAAALLVSEIPPGLMERAAASGAAVLKARSTLTALTRLASAQRDMCEAAVVGITGSTGKTLTKDFAASVLARAGKVTAAKGSHNNDIGVPLTLLEMEADTEYAVLEMGSRGRGHIRRLCAYARPQIGVITNIGWTHLQYFRDRDSLARAKAELLESLPPQGWAVINADDEYAAFLRRASAAPVVTFGCRRSADVRAEGIKMDEMGKASFTLRLEGGGKAKVAVPLPGLHNVENALAAAAIGKIMGVDMNDIARGIADAEVTGWRMEMIKKPEEITIINDAYNANPVSMRSALMALGNISRRKRAIAVLGDMGELGPISEQAHLEVGKLAVDCGTDILITVGRRSRKTAQAARENGLPRGSVFATNGVDKAAEILRAIIEPGDVVLIKGSRFLGLERLVDLVA